MGLLLELFIKVPAIGKFIPKWFNGVIFKFVSTFINKYFPQGLISPEIAQIIIIAAIIAIICFPIKMLYYFWFQFDKDR
jgi:hypothetical protein